MANPKLGAKSVPGVACYPLVTHKKFSNKFWGSHNWCPWTHILDSHIGQSYWTVIMTVLFFIVPVQYDCPVCEKCLNKPSSSHKNVRPLFIVKIWILGYNVTSKQLWGPKMPYLWDIKPKLPISLEFLTSWCKILNLFPFDDDESRLIDLLASAAGKN